MKKVIEKWKNWIKITEHNFEQKIQFIERDNEMTKKKLKEMTKKCRGLNKLLNNQHLIFEEFMNAEREGFRPISLKNLGIDNVKSL